MRETSSKVLQVGRYSICFKEDWHSDLSRAPVAAKSAFSKWARQILTDQPNISAVADSRFTDLTSIGPRFRSCELTKSSVLIFEIDETSRRVTLWMLDDPKAIQKRLLTASTSRASKTRTFSAALLDEWGLEAKLWPLLKDKPLIPRTILGCEEHLGGKLVSSLLQCLLPKSLSEVTQGSTRQIDTNQEVIGEELDHFLLLLEPEQSAVLNRFSNALQRRPDSAGGPWLLKGGPGSGKSTIALYCIHEVLTKPPSLFGKAKPPRVLFTTFTHALRRTSKTLLAAWGGGASRNISLETINQLVNKYDDRRHSILTDVREKREIVRAAIQRVPNRCPYDDDTGNVRLDKIDFLFDEIEGFICGFGLTKLGEYLALARHGAAPLYKERRQYIWNLHTALTELLRERQLTTFARSANHALAKAEACYDYVFIDEAQDLRPIQIRLCAKLCRTRTNLFLTADVNQGIYNTGTSWKSISDDLRFRGRSMVLKRNHRNTASIAAAIAPIAPNGAAVDMETLNVDSRCITGCKPTLMIVDGSLLGAVALNRVVGFLEDSAVQERVGFGCCAILVPTKSLGNEWAAALPKYLNARFFESNDLELHYRGVKILTIHSAKGLQFPVVAVVGLTGGTIGFIGPKDDPESADEVLRRLLFVACSRAMRHLLVQTSRGDPLALLSGAAARADLWNIESLSS